MQKVRTGRAPSYTIYSCSAACLHGLGLEVNPGRMIEVQEALQHICIGHRSDFYYTLRACLVRTT